jgi:ribosomal protein S18 acetylase RimI-like enzyme
VALDLDGDRQAGLAATLEEAARALSAVRYGQAFRLGRAQVVLNPDNPLATGSFASGLDGDLGMVERTLLALPLVWKEAGRSQVVVLASPSSAPELELLAEECGYEAAEEHTTMLLTDPRQLVDGEPGILVRPLPEQDEGLLGTLIAKSHDWGPKVGARLQVVQGHRLDDPRHVAFGAWEGGELVGVGTGFQHGATGQVVEVAVLREHRNRRLGRALASAVAATLLQRGVKLVWLSAEAGSLVEAFFGGLGFEPAYDVTMFTAPVD